MNSFISIFLSFYFLLGGILPNSDFHELSKLPELVAHFMEYDESADDASQSFPEGKIGSVDETDNHHQDGRLPFHEHNTGHTHIYISSQASIDLEANVEVAKKDFTEYRSIISSEHSYSIFQPPRA